jgi:GMP synthase-like glutamine amidotransferase
VETDDPDRIPAGPWLEWHFQRFETPPGTTEIARTPEASQAFGVGPHLGVQFHPEATVEIVEGWARADGVDEATADLAAGPEQREAAAAAAFKLFDGFLATADQLKKRVAI